MDSIQNEKTRKLSSQDETNMTNNNNINSDEEGQFHPGIEVRLQNLTKRFVDKKGNVTVAVDDFSVVIPAGKLVGLLGPSGCGKSTTLYLIAGLHKPNGGQIFFGNEDVTNLPPEKRGIGLVFQNYALFPHLTVRQNIMFPLENMKVPKQEALQRAQEMAELVHIGDLMDRKPSQLSGGQQQRVAIARALVKRPKVLLLDEPLSNLDARLRLQTREEIRRIQRETGITTIFVTHDQEEAMSISDEIIVMERGVMQQLDHPQRVYDEPANLFVARFLGNPPINVFDGVIEGKQLKTVHGKVIQSLDFDIESQEVQIGLRAEFLEVSDNGRIDAEIEIVEHIGRDTMIICKVDGYEKTIRAIVPSSTQLTVGQKIKLDYNKIFVFDKNGARLV